MPLIIESVYTDFNKKNTLFIRLLLIKISGILSMIRHDITEILLKVSLKRRRVRDRMVVGFATTCPISAYHH